MKLTTTTSKFDVAKMTLIGKGERSKVYAHPTDNTKVVKVTVSTAEKKMLRFYFENPREYFVKIYSLEVIGRKMFAVMERLPDVEFCNFPTNEKIEPFYGKGFFESAYMMCADGLEYALFRKNVDSYINRRVSQLDAPESKVREYYNVLLSAHADGAWIPDTAWNLGQRADGTFCCYDTTIQ